MVPILLRAEMSYNKATEFGELLKKHYMEKDVQNMMANPYALFTVLEREGFRTGDDVKRNVINDKYWTFVKESPASTKRKSYVYFADHGKGNVLVFGLNQADKLKYTLDDGEASRRQSVSNTKTRERRHRESIRSEFVQTMAEDSDDEEEVQFTEAALRQSMRFIDALKQAEKSTSKRKTYKDDSNEETEDIDDLFL